MHRQRLSPTRNTLRACAVALAIALGLGLSGNDVGWAADKPKPQPVATSVAPPPGQPVPVNEAIQAWPRLDSRQRHTVIEQIIAAGELELAGQLVARLEARTAADQAVAKLLTGLIRRAEGRLDEAIEIFRALLTDNPQFARVRLELAVALYMKQEDDAARYNFQLVAGAANNPELTKTVNRFIDAIDQRRRWSFASYVSLAPSTNINQGTDTRIVNLSGLEFKVDDHSRRKSGVGVNGGFTGAYRFQLSGPLDLVVGGGAQSKQFRDTRFNDTVVSGEFGPRYRFDWGDVGLYATVARRWFGGEQWWGGDGYALSTGARLAIRYSFDRRNISTGNLACVEKDHDVQRWQDGWNCAINLSHDHHVDSHSFVRILGGVEQERTERSWLDYHAGSIGLGAFREFEHGISLYGQLIYSRREYGGVFPSTSMARTDDRFDASLQLTKRDWTIAGMAPMLQYGFTRNLSNIGLFDHDAHGFNLTLTKTF